MIIGQRARMVAKYLSGGMSLNEKESFQRKLQADDRLKRILAEEQTIENVLQRDKERIPILGNEFPERLQARLTNVQNPPGGSKSPDGSPGSGRKAALMSGPGPLILGAALTIISMASALAIFLGNPDMPAPGIVEAGPAIQHDRLTPNQTQVTNDQPLSNGQTSVGADSGAADHAVNAANSNHPDPIGHNAPEADSRQNGNGKPVTATREKSQQGSKASSEGAVRDYLDKQEQTEGMGVVRSNETRLNVEVKDGKKK